MTEVDLLFIELTTETQDSLDAQRAPQSLTMKGSDVFKFIALNQYTMYEKFKCKQKSIDTHMVVSHRISSSNPQVKSKELCGHRLREQGFVQPGESSRKKFQHLAVPKTAPRELERAFGQGCEMTVQGGTLSH